MGTHTPAPGFTTWACRGLLAALSAQVVGAALLPQALSPPLYARTMRQSLQQPHRLGALSSLLHHRRLLHPAASSCRRPAAVPNSSAKTVTFTSADVSLRPPAPPRVPLRTSAPGLARMSAQGICDEFVRFRENCLAGNCLRSPINYTETINSLSMITKAGVPTNKTIAGAMGP